MGYDSPARGGRDFEMAERKADGGRRAPDRPALRPLSNRAGAATLTEERLRQQKMSFVYGNAPKGSRIVRESAEESVDRLRLDTLTAFSGLDPDAGR